MKLRAFAFTAILLLAACSKVIQENFAKIQDGMTEQEVQALLGKPGESSNITILGLSGTSSRWTAGDGTISVQFVNGKVRAKSFERQPAKYPSSRRGTQKPDIACLNVDSTMRGRLWARVPNEEELA